MTRNLAVREVVFLVAAVVVGHREHLAALRRQRVAAMVVTTALAAAVAAVRLTASHPALVATAVRAVYSSSRI